MINDEKFINTIKLVTLKNALDFNNKIKEGVIISKAFLYSKYSNEIANVKDFIPDIKKIVSDLNKLSLDDKKILYDEIYASNSHYIEKKELIKSIKNGTLENEFDSINAKDTISGLPPLVGARLGNVVTRFPPEPNGYPHIGHAKAAVIDEEYAKRYKGKLILRYDDTNPVKEKLEYYEAIKEGLDWLGIKPDITKNTSDDIKILYEYGRKLIYKGFAYACFCSAEVIKNNRTKGIKCDCAKNSIENNIKSFEEMIKGNYDQNQAILRYNGNMSDLNTVMRDPTLFRIIKGNHPKLGSDIVLWPTYDFATPIEDSLDGVTYAFRTKEYELRNKLYYSILDHLNLDKPTLIEFSRLEFEGIPVSKRKITPLIEKGIIQRWDDPRLPTLMGLRRRGIMPDAIRKFVLSLSITLAETKPSFEILEAFNRKIIDPFSVRLFFVKDPIKLYIDNLDIEEVNIRNHPNNVELGTRRIEIDKMIYISKNDAINLKPGDKIRLMDLRNIEVMAIEGNNNEFDYDSNTQIFVKNIGNDISHSMQKIQWVSNKDKRNLSILKSLQLYNGEVYNENSLLIDKGISESYISKLRIGTIIQFVRYGFCRIDDLSTAIFTHR